MEYLLGVLAVEGGPSKLCGGVDGHGFLQSVLVDKLRIGADDVVISVGDGVDTGLHGLLGSLELVDGSLVFLVGMLLE